MKFASRLVATLLALYTGAEATGENAHAFKALCQAFNAATAPINDADYTGGPNTVTTPDDLLYLLMTSLPAAEFSNATSQSIDNNTDGWKAKKAALAAKKDDKNKPIYQLAPDGPTKTALAPALKRLYEEAKQLETAAQALHAEVEQATAAARKAMAEAAYGQPEAKEVPPTQFADRATTCGGAAEDTKPGVSIAHDMVCVCSGATAGTNICGDGIGTTTYDNTKTSSDAADVKELFTALKNKCELQRTYSKASPAAIRAALTAFEQTLGKKVTDGVGVQLKLGNNAASDCTGTNSETTCVNYAGVAPAGNINKINWVAKLDEAADKLAEAASKRPALEAAKVEMKQKQTTAWATAALLKLKLPDMPQTTQTAAKEQTSESDCNRHQTSDKCKDPCKWNENNADKTKKCSLDPKKAADQAAQATGSGDGTTGTTTNGCEKHFTDENGCKKMNEGKDKPVCAWKKGGENDKEKDELRCRNGSFLLSKQFALSMVSAAFVALLF
uniref:Variant surface glycoprotein n=1 Tax=Trypanosoma brucei TaxID=5691 RepID=A0A1V0G0A7_9TRYP|nr:variant surface glycoprotein [Trypanosoma brucei]